MAAKKTAKLVLMEMPASCWRWQITLDTLYVRGTTHRSKEDAELMARRWAKRWLAEDVEVEVIDG